MAHAHIASLNPLIELGLAGFDWSFPKARQPTSGRSLRRRSLSNIPGQGREPRTFSAKAHSGLCERDQALRFHSPKRSRGAVEECNRFSAGDAINGHGVCPSGKAVACRASTGAMEEALYFREGAKSFIREESDDWWGGRVEFEGRSITSKQAKSPFPKYVNDRADDVALHNPLKRLERLGCGWLAVLLEWEGVMVEDDPALERRSWAMLAEEEGKPLPPGFLLRRADGMKNEQAIMEVFCWSREYKNVKRLAQRRDEIFEQLQGGRYRLRPGSKEFVDFLRKNNTPIAVLSTRPRLLLDRAIEAVGMEGFFDLAVSAEDVQRGKPDPEMFQYAATCLGFIPERCIVVGTSNSTVEGAHDALMKVVAVAGKHPAYELGAADLVVPRLDDLSIVDLKNLADLDSVEFTPTLELEAEPEEERILPRTSVAER